jgi:hypothetical protein
MAEPSLSTGSRLDLTDAGIALSPRDRRLRSDAQQLMAAFAGHPNIRIEAVGASPPERYRLVYNVPGLWLDSDSGNVAIRQQHVVDMYLPPEYPRDKPYCTTPNPVFHPNFGNYVCIADHWSPGQALVDVVVQIGDMLQYRTYNTDSPLNALAARWVTVNPGQVPLANIDLLPREPEIQLR